MSKKSIFGQISKVEEQDDGTLKVWGIASTEAEDSDGEVITSEAMKAALPDYMKFGAIREMHQPKAAGTALEVGVDESGVTKICAHVVDSEAVKKVKAGVYKGFSIGGRVTGRDELKKTTITGLALTEISLVDRPANPDAVITCYKADGIEDPDPATAVEPENQPDTIQKGMYSVSRLADILSSVSYLAQDAQWEAEYEGDNSPIPKKLVDWFNQGAEILKAMTEEELAEMTAILQSAVAEKSAKADDLQKASATDDLQKAGRRNSTSDQAALNQILALVKQLGAEDESEGGSDDADKMTKADKTGLASDQIEKAKTHDELVKVFKDAGFEAADLTEVFTKMMKDKNELTKRVAELEALPAAGKGVLKSVEKGQDLSLTEVSSVQPVKDESGTVNDAATLIKMAQTKPQRLM